MFHTIHVFSIFRFTCRNDETYHDKSYASGNADHPFNHRIGNEQGDGENDHGGHHENCNYFAPQSKAPVGLIVLDVFPQEGLVQGIVQLSGAAVEKPRTQKQQRSRRKSGYDNAYNPQGSGQAAENDEEGFPGGRLVWFHPVLSFLQR